MNFYYLKIDWWNGHIDRLIVTNQYGTRIWCSDVFNHIQYRTWYPVGWKD